MNEIRAWLQEHPILAIVIAVALTIIAMSVAHDVIKKFYLRLLQLVGTGLVVTGFAGIATGRFDANELLLAAVCIVAGATTIFAVWRLDRQYQARIKEMEGKLKKHLDPAFRVLIEPNQEKPR